MDNQTIPSADPHTGEVLGQQETRANYPPLHFEVAVRPVSPTGNLVGFADVKINGAFLIRGFKVLIGDKGMFVGAPSRKEDNGEYRDVAFPLTAEAREQLHEAIIDGYNTAINKMREILNASTPEDKF